MGIASMDTYAEPFNLGKSGSFNNFPPGIHETLSREEVEKRYPFYKGSGGIDSPLTYIQISGSNTQFSISPQNEIPSAVNEILDAFGLTKEEAVNVFRVSRKTLYNWLDKTSAPRKSAKSRIYDLLLTARAWESYGLSNPRAVLDTKIINEQSVLDMLSTEKIDQELILFAGSRLSLSKFGGSELADPFV